MAIRRTRTAGATGTAGLKACVAAAAVAVVVGGWGAEPVGSPGSGTWGRLQRRGANVGLWLKRGDLEVLAGWGADHVRLQLLAAYFQPEGSRGHPWLTPAALEALARFLSDAKAVGLGVVVDLHAHGLFFPDAHWQPGVIEAWQDRERVRRLAAFWREMARWLKDKPAVVGVDILNEPHPPGTPEGYAAWNEVAREVTRAIREVDGRVTVVVECAGYANPGAMTRLRPTGDGNTVYSFHMYAPHEFTEQGTRPQWPFGQVYPGVIELGWDKKKPVYVDRKWLERAVEPVARFQRRTAARVWVGEFSARREAPRASALKWLEDVLEIFEQHRWDWCYHAFREAACWDLEIPAQAREARRQPSTARLELLKRYFAAPRAEVK